jgi:hypothetical protein
MFWDEFKEHAIPLLKVGCLRPCPVADADSDTSNGEITSFYNSLWKQHLPNLERITIQLWVANWRCARDQARRSSLINHGDSGILARSWSPQQPRALTATRLKMASLTYTQSFI